MTFRWILFLLVVTFCGGLLLSSCAPPSDDAIMDAEDAIKKAATAGADEASPTLLNQARELLQEAKMLREQGNNREARNKAALAIIRAQKAERHTLSLTGEGHESEEGEMEEGEEELE